MPIPQLVDLVPPEAPGVWTFLLVGGLAAALVSMVKAGFGGSIGLLSVPLMIYACGGHAFLATGIMLPLLIACDYVSMAYWWRQWRLRPVMLLLPGAFVGVGCGWAVLAAILAGTAGSRAANASLMIGIGVIAIGFVLLQLWRRRGEPVAFRPGWRSGTGLGALAGLTSTISHAAGPLVTMYMLPQRMPSRQFVASTVLYYWIGNQAKLVPYLAIGIVNQDMLRYSATLLPATVLGAVAGLLLHKRLGAGQFSAVVYALLALAGVHLVYSAVRQFVQ